MKPVRATAPHEAKCRRSSSRRRPRPTPRGSRGAEELGLTTQPLASIAKREEVIYLYGQEDDPIVLDRRSPVLHLIQRIRDESHRFFHTANAARYATGSRRCWRSPASATHPHSGRTTLRRPARRRTGLAGGANIGRSEEGGRGHLCAFPSDRLQHRPRSCAHLRQQRAENCFLIAQHSHGPIRRLAAYRCSRASRRDRPSQAPV